MASTIITKNSSTASAVPVVGDLTKGELAVNVTDKKIYTKDNSAAVVKLVGSLGNQEANAVAITGGSIAGITDLAVADGGTGASTASDARTNLGLGTIATQAASSVTITGGSVTGITDITVADGGTGASTAANARSNLGAAASGANSDITSLSGLTTALSVAQGGTGITSFGSGVATFLGTPSSANLLAAVTDETGTGALVFANTPTLVAPLLGTPTSGNFSTGTFTWPTFNQNTTGTAAGLSSTLAIASGGTGATTAGGALTSLGAYAASNPSGYTSNTGTVTSVGGTGTVNGLTLTGTVTTSGNLTLGGTLSGVSLTSQVSGTLPTANGGTNLTSFTSGGVVYASSTSALATGSALTFDGSKLDVNCGTNSEVRVTTSGSGYLQVGQFANGAFIGTSSTDPTAGALRFGSGGAEGLRLTSTSLYTASGINVGFGTSSPVEKLTVNGAIAVTGGITGHGANRTTLSQEGVNGAFWQSYGANTSTYGTYVLRQASSDFSLTRNAVVIDGAGNLGLGVTPSAWGSPFLGAFEGKAGTALVGRSDAAQTFLFNNLYFNGTNYIRKATGYGNFILLDGYSGGIGFNIAGTGSGGTTASPTQAMTLDASGNLLVGNTSIIGSGKTNVWFDGASAQGMNLQTTFVSPGSGFLGFYNSSGSNIGSVTQSTGSAVLYNVTSDQRLKENIVDAPDFGNVIDSIQVRSFDWKSDSTHQRAGFIAQELLTVAPEAVHQPIKQEDMMAVDYSKLVPMLVKEIQSLRQRLSAANL